MNTKRAIILLLTIVLLYLLLAGKSVKIPSSYALLTDELRNKYGLKQEVLVFNPNNKYTIRLLDSKQLNNVKFLSEAIFDNNGKEIKGSKTGLLPMTNPKLHLYAVADKNKNIKEIKLGDNVFVNKHFPKIKGTTDYLYITR